MKKFFVLIFVLLVVVTSVVAIPTIINLQGYLTDNAGNPINGTKTMVFKIYSQPTGGAVLWTEPQSGVSIDGGFYSVQLGSVTPFGPTTFDLAATYESTPSRYLGVAVGDDPEMTPRLPIAIVPYSLMSAFSINAMRVSGQDAIVNVGKVVTGTLEVNGNSSIGGNLFVNGISTIEGSLRVKSSMLILPPVGRPSSGTPEGVIGYDSDHHFYGYTGSSGGWKQLD